MSRSRLEALEAAGYEPASGELLVALVWLVLGELPIADDELNASRRRAMFVLAAGGDPHRELDLNSVAAERLAGELDSPERRKALPRALSGARRRQASRPSRRASPRSSTTLSSPGAASGSRCSPTSSQTNSGPPGRAPTLGRQTSSDLPQPP